jgi:hypothetical protein
MGSTGALGGVLAGLLWALWPGALFTFYDSSELLTENVAIPALLLALWARQRSRAAGAIVAGLLTGIAILARPYLLLLLPALAVLEIVLRRASLRAWVGGSMLFALFALVPPSLWMWRNRVVFADGLFLSTQQGYGLWLGNHEGARGSWNGHWDELPAMDLVRAHHPDLSTVPEPVKSRIFLQEALGATRRRGPGGNAVLIARKAALFLWPFDTVEGFHWWLALAFPLAAFGVAVSLRAPPDDVMVFLYAWLVAIGATTLVFYHDVRLRYCAEPVLVAFAAISLSYWLRRGAARPEARC